MFAGPYGLIYDYSIEREWLMRAVGRAVWGIDMSVLYASMEVIGRVTDGATILDVPCGGGVAFRALRPDQDVRYIAADLSEEMLGRARRRATQQSLSRVEFAVARSMGLSAGQVLRMLALEYATQHASELDRKVYPVPPEIDREIARLKLETMGVDIDTLTEEQARYLASWDEGT